MIRGATRSVVENPHIEAARAMGIGHVRIMIRHILPNVAPTILVVATISLVVFGFNMLGDALRDVLDPRLRGAVR